MVGKYREAQGSIKGLQEQVQGLQAKQATESETEGGGGDGNGSADPAFGATIAALQTQLREVTQAKEEAEQRVAAVVGRGGGGDDGDTAPPTPAPELSAASDERVKELEKGYEESLAAKQSENEVLIQKLRELATRYRSLQEDQQQQQQAAGAGPGAGVGVSNTAVDVSEASLQETSTPSEAASVVGGSDDMDDLRAQLQRSKQKNATMVAKLKEFAQRNLALEAQGEDGSSPKTPAPAASDAEVGGDNAASDADGSVERLTDADSALAAADDRVAELVRRCQQAEAAHKSATLSLNDALARVAELESLAASTTDVSPNMAAAAQEGSLQETTGLREENAGLREKVNGLEEELRGSLDEKQEVSAQLGAKTADFEKMVSQSQVSRNA